MLSAGCCITDSRPRRSLLHRDLSTLESWIWNLEAFEPILNQLLNRRTYFHLLVFIAHLTRTSGAAVSSWSKPTPPFPTSSSMAEHRRDLGVWGTCSLGTFPSELTHSYHCRQYADSVTSQSPAAPLLRRLSVATPYPHRQCLYRRGQTRTQDRKQSRPQCWLTRR